MEEGQKRPVKTLRCLISYAFIDEVKELLASHGASMEEIEDHPAHGEQFKVYTITFPEGTTRAYGLRMMRSHYFRISFPDQFELQGLEMWPLAQGENDRPINAFQLPPKA